MNKTAVQWLFEEYKKREIATDEMVELFKQAEQREKEQIIEAYDKGQNNPYEYSEDNDVNWYDGRTYYSETFKSE